MLNSGKYNCNSQLSRRDPGAGHNTSQACRIQLVCCGVRPRVAQGRIALRSCCPALVFSLSAVVLDSSMVSARCALKVL